LIFGGDQRVDNQSHDYKVVRLDRESPHEWDILTPLSRPSKSAPEAGEEVQHADDSGDIAFEHRESGAIISLNSVCREYRNASLEDLTENLLMGLNTTGEIQTKEIELDGTKALEAHVEASMSGRSPGNQKPSKKKGKPTEDHEPVRVRTVVMQKHGCTYDLMYVATPSAFEKLTPVFERFLKGFHAD
jgi:hypothetical protein